MRLRSMALLIGFVLVTIQGEGGEIKFKASSAAEGSKSVVDIAKSLRCAEQRDQVDKALADADESPFVKSNEKLHVSVQLLRVFHAFEYGISNATLEVTLGDIAQKRIDPWQEYLLEMAHGRLAVQQKDFPKALKKVDWLISNFDGFNTARSHDPLCGAFYESLSGPKGPFLAGLLVSKGTMLEKQGKLDEAKKIYEEVIRVYSGTGWATSAKRGLVAIGATGNGSR